MSMKLAVLPLEDSSPDANQGYVGEGISDELLHALSWVEDLYLAPLSSSMRFKGPDTSPETAAEQLKVDIVLTGSAHHENDEIRLTARLLDISGKKELWSESYARPIAELGDVEDDVLRNVVKALELTGVDSGSLTVQKGWTTSTEAYDYYLQGLSFFRRYAIENLRKALEKFQLSLKADPEFARAWARLAECHAKFFMYHDSGNREHIERAAKASDRAVKLAPEFARAHTARGVAWLMEKEFMKAEESFDRAVELHPRMFDAWFWHARTCFQQGRLQKAIDLFEKAADVQPDDYQTPLLLRQAYLSQGEVDKAQAVARRGIALAQEHLRLNRKDARAIYLACGSMIQLGMYQQAMEWAERALAVNPEDPMINYNVACCFAQAGEPDRAMDCLEKARGSGMVNAGWLKNDSDLFSLHDNPRFKELLEKMAE